MKRLHSSAGIAIGPILFMLAILGVIASVMSAGGSTSFGTAGVADRVTSDIIGQANLIRTKIQECQMQYEINGTNYSSDPCMGDSYPCSDEIDGTPVAALTCPNDPLNYANEEYSLWSGLRVSSLPPASKGFESWIYYNGGTMGGRCFYTKPQKGSVNVGAKQGLQRAASKFTSQEISYIPESSTQKFVVWVTLPRDWDEVSEHCSVP